MSLRRLALALGAALAIGSGFIRAQVPGQNVNIVSKDPYLQKQNEPSIAVSTRNPCTLLVGLNDYIAVNVPGLPADKETGDAWVGWYESHNCGDTWTNKLVPGFLQDGSAEGIASPVKGLTTAADATVRSGPGGFFAYSFIAFNRGSNVGKLAVARFIDKNQKEAGPTISYIDTKVWDSGSAGQFLDKPYMAVTKGTGTCSVGGLTVPASTVHLVWTVFVGNSDQIIRTKVYYARSSNCGGTLDAPPTKLSEGYPVNQGATIAITPNGNVYVAWRQFGNTKGDFDQILFAKSIDGGKTFTKAAPVPSLNAFIPFDQGSSSKTFRTNAFPTMAADQFGRVYLAVAARGFATGYPNQSRVVVTSTTDGVTWTGALPIENLNSTLGHQIMPALTAVDGRLNAVWLDFRDDVSGAGAKDDDFIKEIYSKRHSMDVRGAQAVAQAGGGLTWNAYGILQNEVVPTQLAPRISQYKLGNFKKDNTQIQPPINKFKQLLFNLPNLKLYAGGTRPFVGDFIDVAGLAFIAQQNSTQVWAPNDGSIDLTAAHTFYAAWTDNRDALTPPTVPELEPDDALEGPTLDYAAPGGTCPAGKANLTGTRNANVYLSRISPGLFVAAPSNAKPLLSNGVRIQRAFPVLVKNNTKDTRTFRLTIATPLPANTYASFVQVQETAGVQPPIPPATAAGLSTDVVVPGKSGASRAVYVVSASKYPQIRVNVVEQGPAPADALTGSTILNPDIENPDIENPDIENPDIENPDIENAEVHNPDIENPDIENPDIENPDIENPDIENPDIENPDIENPDLQNPDIENPDIENPDIENPDIENPDIENGAITDYSVDVTNEGNTTSTYQVNVKVTGDKTPYIFQLIGRREYRTPAASGCTLKQTAQQQVLFNVTNPDVTGHVYSPLDGNVKNPTMLLKPGETVKVTLRAWDKDVLTGANVPANDGIQPFCPALSASPTGPCQVITNQVTITVGSVSSNTGSNTPPSDTLPSTPDSTPLTFIVTNTNDSGPGSLRQAITTANARPGLDNITFKIPGSGVHTITPASPLPQIADRVVIDGTTQSGYAGAPLIELNGTSAGGSGLTLAAGSGSVLGGCPPPVIGGEGGGPTPCDPVLDPGSTIRGLAINRFAGNGILIQSNGNTIAGNYIGTNAAGTADGGTQGNGIEILDAGNNRIGTTPGGPVTDRNIVSGNNGEGIRLDGALATGNMIRGNYIGTSASGTAPVPNSASGVFLRKAPGNSVIGNLISSNLGFAGVAICGDPDGDLLLECGGGPSPGTNTSNASGNIVQGNLIGTDVNGTAPLGNSQIAGIAGVSIDAAPNTLVGGPLAGDGNVISANKGHGVVIFNPGADNNVIRGNYIGTTITGAAALGNNGDGVRITAGSGNVVGGVENTGAVPNVIMFNTGNGIALLTSSGAHEFRMNRISANGGLGISGSSPGPNLTSATMNGGSLTVAGSFLASPGTVTVDLYKNAVCDPSGFGEGAEWLGFFTVGVPSDSPVSFARTIDAAGIANGDVVTATVTTLDQSATPEATGATTRFSNCQMAVPPGFVFSAPSAGGNGHVYEYVPTPGTWTAANTAAPSRSFRGVAGHLATITSAVENGVVDTLRNNNQMRGWIGLTDQNVEGTYQWVTGEPFGFASWSAGEPNNGSVTGTNNEDFIEFFAGGVWNDTTNGEVLNLGYVVEYDISPF